MAWLRKRRSGKAPFSSLSDRFFRQANYQSYVLSIALFSPLVIGARMQMLAMQALRPTPAGRREIRRMSDEKQAATIDSFAAMQRSFMASDVKFWSDMLKGSAAFSAAAPTGALAAATVPVRRRVRANSRRLTGL